jgi:hypothetical protein
MLAIQTVKMPSTGGRGLLFSGGRTTAREDRLWKLAMINSVAQTASAIAVLITLAFLASQTRKLQRQIDLNNTFNRYEALNHSSERYDQALALLFQQPQLRPYIYEEKPLDLTGVDLDRALIIADMLAGAVDYALRVGEKFPDEGTSDWGVVAEDFARQPLFRHLVSRIPHQFPDLAPFFADNPALLPSAPTGDATEGQIEGR